VQDREPTLFVVPAIMAKHLIGGIQQVLDANIAAIGDGSPDRRRVLEVWTARLAVSPTSAALTMAAARGLEQRGVGNRKDCRQSMLQLSFKHISRQFFWTRITKVYWLPTPASVMQVGSVFW
jgi:hypothetical protein